MVKMIFLLVGLAVGFGGGVYWGVKYPTEARKLATEEERRFLEAQKALLEKTKRKLDELIARSTGATSAPAGGTRSTLVSPQAAKAAPAPAPDPEVLALREEHERQLQEAEKLLKEAGRL